MTGAWQGPGTDVPKKREIQVRTSLLLALVVMTTVAHATPFSSNPIITENAQAGDPTFEIPEQNVALEHEIEGYADAVSVNVGGLLTYFVNSSTSEYAATVYRMGWYGGAGARKVLPTRIQSRIVQPLCPEVADTGLIECAWVKGANDSTTLDTSGWLSGVYVIKLETRPASGVSVKQSHIVFVVRDDSRASDFVFQTQPTTYQAYNSWGSEAHGKSLYAVTLPDQSVRKQAIKVSFDRPYFNSNPAEPPLLRQALAAFLKEEYPVLRFMEKEGLDVSYTTDMDVGVNPSALLSHRAVVVPGHGEYWSMATREALDAARDHHVNLAIFAANTGYWQVRYEDGAGGRPRRRVAAWKEFALTAHPNDAGVVSGGWTPDPLLGTSSARYVTTLFRNAPVNMPENRLFGVRYQLDPGANGFELPLNLSATALRTWTPLLTGVGVSASTDVFTVNGILGYEADGELAPTDGVTTCLRVLGTSEWTNMEQQAGLAHTVLYRPPNNSGGTVFSSGTILWGWGLDNWASCRRLGNPPECTPAQKADPAYGVDSRVIGITRNLFQWFRRTPKLPIATSCYLPPMPGGRTDVIVQAHGSPVTWSHALSNGTAFVPQAAELSNWPPPGSNYDLFSGDFDGDGRADIVAKQRTAPGAWLVALGNGSGFVPQATPWLSGSFAVVSADHDLFVGDFDGDGKDDLLAKERTAPGPWLVALSNGTGFVPESQAWLPGGWAATSADFDLFVGDFNGDGKDDLLAKERTAPGNWAVALSANHSFVPEDHNWLTGWAVESAAYDLRVGDFDGDGRDDLVAKERNAPNRWFMARAEGQYFFPQSSCWLKGWAAVSSAYDVRVGDYNGDGADDLLAKSRVNGTWDVALSHGTRFVPEGQSWLTNWMPGAQYDLLVGDVNGN